LISVAARGGSLAGENSAGALCTPGTPDLGAVLEPYVPHYDALLLANQWRGHLRPRFAGSIFPDGTLEHFCEDCIHSELTGEPQLLTTREVAKLMAARAGIT